MIRSFSLFLLLLLISSFSAGGANDITDGAVAEGTTKGIAEGAAANWTAANRTATNETADGVSEGKPPHSAVILVVDGLGASYVYPEHSAYALDGSPLRRIEPMY